MEAMVQDGVDTLRPHPATGPNTGPLLFHAGNLGSFKKRSVQRVYINFQGPIMNFSYGKFFSSIILIYTNTVKLNHPGLRPKLHLTPFHHACLCLPFLCQTTIFYSSLRIPKYLHARSAVNMTALADPYFFCFLHFAIGSKFMVAATAPRFLHHACPSSLLILLTLSLFQIFDTGPAVYLLIVSISEP